MKKQKFISLLSAVLFLMSLGLFVFPRPSSAINGGKLYQSTTCNGPDSSWPCNNCIDGVSNCYDHSCAECLDPKMGG